MKSTRMTHINLYIVNEIFKILKTVTCPLPKQIGKYALSHTLHIKNKIDIFSVYIIIV